MSYVISRKGAITIESNFVFNALKNARGGSSASIPPIVYTFWSVYCYEAPPTIFELLVNYKFDPRVIQSCSYCTLF